MIHREAVFDPKIHDRNNPPGQPRDLGTCGRMTQQELAWWQHWCNKSESNGGFPEAVKATAPQLLFNRLYLQASPWLRPQTPAQSSAVTGRAVEEHSQGPNATQLSAAQRAQMGISYSSTVSWLQLEPGASYQDLSCDTVIAVVSGGQSGRDGPDVREAYVTVDGDIYHRDFKGKYSPSEDAILGRSAYEVVGSGALASKAFTGLARLFCKVLEA